MLKRLSQVIGIRSYSNSTSRGLKTMTKPQQESYVAAQAAQQTLLSIDTKWDPAQEIPQEIKQLIEQQRGSSEYSCILAFQQILSLLKTQKRTGWLNHDILECESIADHMYRMSLITMSLNARNLQKESPEDERIDLSKCCQIALVHDLAEALVGDIVPHDTQVDKLEKGKREYKTILYLCELIKPYNAPFSNELENLWLDYELQRNFNAKIVKDIDKYELILSAFQYEQRFGGSKDLQEFFSAADLIKTDEVKKMAAELMRQRALFWKTCCIRS